MLSRSDRGIINATAFVRATSGQNSDGDEGSAKEDVEEDSDESEKCDSSKKACKNNGEGCIDDGSTAHAFNRLFPFRNRMIASSSSKDYSRISHIPAH